MRNVILISTLVCCISCSKSIAMKLPGPRVYVVTPSSRPQIDEGRAAPFYYHNWIRRVDSSQNDTSPTATITSTTTKTTKSPDLIFAEFESDHAKNIRKLLERERITTKTTTTTPTPIYVPEETMVSQHVDSESLMNEKEDMKPVTKDKTDYFALYNNLYGNNEHLPAPVFVPTTAAPATTVLKPTTTTTTEKPNVSNVENIWHIIDSEKHNQYVGQWDEVPVSPEDERTNQRVNTQDEETNQEKGEESDDDSAKLDENFALPGFATNRGSDAENESRAIRTEPNIRFPYVNLKPFMMQNSKKPLLKTFSNSKKGNNMYTSLDNFFDIQNPVRGEVEDKGTIRQQQQPIDRYNPAQPYLPSPEYGSKSKQSTPNSSPAKTVAQLVPPPPPAPQLTADDFPAPVSYESFPPYPQAGPAPAPPKPISRPQPPTLNDDSDAPPSGDSDDDDGPPMDLGYRYKPPSPPSQPFLPTVSPLKPSFGGYSYNKPPMSEDAPPGMDDKPDFQGYSYDKPAPEMPEKPFHGYQYNKPEPPPSPPMDHPPSYGSQGPPDNGDYPELIFNKPHGDSNGMKGGDDSMGMMPPPAPFGKGVKPDLSLSGPPGDDSGFPHDFPSDFKFHHDFDDHDFYHHHHPTTTTTTTTETPRVNRYSYYYLGKKLYYLPLYFSVYFIIYVGALIIKAVLRHKIVYPNSFRPNDDTASYFAKRSVDTWDLSNENLHEMTGRVTHAIATAAEKYISNKTAKRVKGILTNE